MCLINHHNIPTGTFALYLTGHLWRHDVPNRVSVPSGTKEVDVVNVTSLFGVLKPGVWTFWLWPSWFLFWGVFHVGFFSQNRRSPCPRRPLVAQPTGWLIHAARPHIVQTNITLFKLLFEDLILFTDTKEAKFWGNVMLALTPPGLFRLGWNAATWSSCVFEHLSQV